VARTLTEAGLPAASVRVDLADETSIVKACADVIADHGSPWIAVNNAGLQDRQLLLTRELGRVMVTKGKADASSISPRWASVVR
jgi:NAD(P)-dependent dehydrogenase (short-subunit alcohol dehydrogenase family)